MKFRPLLLLLTLLALLVAACAGDGGTGATTATAPTIEPESTTTTQAAATTEAPPTTEATTSTTEATTTTMSAGDPAALAGLRTSLAQTAEVTSGRMEGSFEVSGVEGLDTAFVMPFSGAFDNEAGAFTFIMDLSFMAAVGGEEIPPEFAGMLGEMEVRQIGDTAYIRFPFFSGFLGVQTEWISTPAEESGSATSGFTGATPGNPADFLEMFEDANATVEELGSETIRGVATTHYRVVFDTEALLAQATPEERAELERQGPIPLERLPMDIWISGDGLVYRYVIEIDGSEVEAQPGESFDTMIMTFELFDYGSDVGIEAPPADEVTPMEELEGFFDPANT